MRRLKSRFRARADRYLRARVGEGVAAALPPQPDPPPAPPAPLHGTYVGNNRMLTRTLWGGRILVPADDLSLTPELVAYGTYDVPFTAFVQREIEPGDTVVDVGANIGLFTVLLGYQVWERGRVLAFEASPRILDLLRDNVSLNWLSDRVEIIPVAAGAAPGRQRFVAPQRFAMTGSLQPIDDLLVTEDRRDTLEHFDVDVEPLDDRLSGLERIDLIKIDVEGGEEQVFAGLERTLAAGVVRRLTFELDPLLLGDDWPAFQRRLRALDAGGWAFATISEAGVPEPAELDALFARHRVSQVLMTPATP